MLWSAELPYLYTINLELLNAAGNVIETTTQQYGFRKIEIRNKKVYINNALTYFKGANRHDIHPQLGKAVPVESMIEDILLFKRFNLNTIRTSHYPMILKCMRYTTTMVYMLWMKLTWNAMEICH